MEPVTLDQLEVFRMIAETGSFSAAAAKLGRAQSAISYQIGNLEALLGLELFDRSTRRPTLTEAGRSLLADAARVGQEVGRLVAHARAIGEGAEPQLSLAVDSLFPLRPLLAGLAAFREAFPETPVRLYSEALGAVPALVAEGTCSLGIGQPHLGVGLEPLEVKALDRAVEMVTVAAPSHALAAEEGALSTAQLARHTQLVLTDRSRLTEGTDFGVLSLHSWRLADLGTKHACLKAGFGFGSMPLHLVAEDLASGALVQLHPEANPKPFVVPISALWRRADPPGPAARWLLAQLELEEPEAGWR